MFISQTTDFHFANYRFSFRKLQILISQTTDSHFANYRFPFRFVPFRFVPFRFVPFRFANYSKPSKTIPFGAAHTYIHYIGEYPPPGFNDKKMYPETLKPQPRLKCYLYHNFFFSLSIRFKQSKLHLVQCQHSHALFDAHVNPTANVT